MINGRFKTKSETNKTLIKLILKYLSVFIEFLLFPLSFNGSSKKQFSLQPEIILIILFQLIIFIGVILAIYQFVFNRSLWLDEASLALNIIRRNFQELTMPLEYLQVAPLGFLFIEKNAVLIYGKTDLALRIFPLISFLASIVFFYLFSNKLVKDKLIALLATSIFSTSIILISYSSEVKQYSSDVLITLIILYYTLKVQSTQNRSLFTYAIIGSIAIWFSNVSIIILFITGVYILYTETYKRKNYKILLPLLLWLLSFCIYYILFIHNHPYAEWMITYWKKAFLPINPFSSTFYDFLHGVLKRDIYGYILNFGAYWYIPLLVSLSAIIYLIKNKKYAILYFCLAPIIVHLILSILMLYPFSKRLILYNAPLIILLFSIGLYNLVKYINKIIIRLPYILLIIPILIAFNSKLSKFPIEKEEIKKSLNYIERNINKDDEIYVYYKASRAFMFYEETNMINITNPIIYGKPHWNINFEKYNHDLLNLKGKVWLLFSHVFPFKKENEEKYMVYLLLNNGSELLDKKKYKGSTVYLVDTKK